MHKSLVHLYPVFIRAAIAYLHGYLLEVLLVARLGHLSHYFLSMYILLQRQQYLVGVNRLYQIVGNLRPDGLIHNVLLLALGHHNHRHRR